MVILKKLFSLILAIVLLIVLTIAGTLFANRTPLHKEPGILIRLDRYLTENVAETEEFAAFPELRMPVYKVPPQHLYDTAIKAAIALGWEVHSPNGENLTFKAVATTPMWHFEDDVSVQVVAKENGSSALFVRSASRVGRADFGANARRIAVFRRAVETRL